MKRIGAGILTMALMGVLVASGMRRGAEDSGTSNRSTETLDPAETVEALIEDSKRGDVSSYLDAFASPLRQRLEREASERGRDSFAGDLKRAALSRKSYAIFAVEGDGPDSARVNAESVYADRNERQSFRMERIDGRWRIAEVETSRSHQPRAKFGAPAEFKGPEGEPVPGGVVAEDSDNVGSR